MGHRHRELGSQSLRLVVAAAAILAGVVVSPRPGQAQDALVPMVELEGNLVAIGVGAYPDYLGSNDYSIGAVPLAHYSFWGRRDITLLGNAVNVNVLDVPGWRFGPSAMVRFGRSADRLHGPVPARARLPRPERELRLAAGQRRHHGLCEVHRRGRPQVAVT